MMGNHRLLLLHHSSTVTMVIVTQAVQVSYIVRPVK
jgi:hypothetical protein